MRACASVGERAEAWNALQRVEEIETARVAEDASAEKSRLRGAIPIAVRGDGRAAASVLAGTVL